MKKLKQIYVICETKKNCELTELSKKMLIKAKLLSEQLLCGVTAIIFGTNILENDDINKLDIKKFIIHCEIPFYDNYPFKEIIDCIDKELLICIILKENPFWKNIATMCAFYYKGGLIADCSDIIIDANTSKLIFKRISYSGRKEAQIITSNNAPAICTIREENVKNSFENELEINKKISPISCVNEGDSLIKIYDMKNKHRIDDFFSLKKRKIIFGIGRGVNFDTIKLIEQIALKINAGIGYSKPLIDNGYADYEKQIGYSGQEIKCELYIAIGISGSIHHMSAVKKCNIICAVNIDPNSRIFNYANICILVDSFEFVQKLNKRLCNCLTLDNNCGDIDFFDKSK